jgi:hypothetical protein
VVFGWVFDTGGGQHATRDLAHELTDTWERRMTARDTQGQQALGALIEEQQCPTRLSECGSTVQRVEPHAMLVYGKGQFFLPHQDSEKRTRWWHAGDVAALGAHRRGAGRRPCRREQDLSSVEGGPDVRGVYSDCRHEVTPVRSGYRVTLTFNLLADTGTLAPEAGPVTELAQCLTEHFTTPATPRYGGRELDPPNRLVFPLDHEYTQRAWPGAGSRAPTRSGPRCCVLRPSGQGARRCWHWPR